MISISDSVVTVTGTDLTEEYTGFFLLKGRRMSTLRRDRTNGN